MVLPVAKEEEQVGSHGTVQGSKSVVPTEEWEDMT